MPDQEVVRLKGELLFLTRVMAAVVIDQGGDLHISRTAILEADAGGLENAAASDGDGIRLHYNAGWKNDG